MRNWPKHLLQWAVLILIVLSMFKVFGNDAPDPEAYCPMGGLETVGTYLVQGSMACSMTTSQIMMGIALGIAAILFGKLFCSYLCPLGLVDELFYRLRRLLKIKAIAIRNGSTIDSVFRLFKYVLLFLVFYITLSSSELFCKNFDPYYAAASGFKGELTIWMAAVALALFVVGGLLSDMFWCKYICPLGAAANLFKFSIWFVGYGLIYWALTACGVNVPWIILLAGWCIIGYLLEILVRRPRLNPQLLAVRRDSDKCNGCGHCEKRCPYHIDIKNVAKVTSIDCSICGECVAACNKDALTLGRKKWSRFLPAIITVAMFFGALWLGNETELPTIDEKWGMEELSESSLKSFHMGGLRSVKCYGSSKTFSAKLQRIAGVHGVKTYVKHHEVDIFFDPSVTNEDTIREAIYVPSSFRINSFTAGDADSLMIITIRTENMYDKLDVNYLGMQFRNTGRRYYGLETEFACPLIVRLYIHPDEVVDKNFLKKTVEKEILDMPAKGGTTTPIECDYKFVKLEESYKMIPAGEYLNKMFSPFKAEFKSRLEQFDGQPQAVMEYSKQDYEKPIILRNMPFLSNHLSQMEGIIGVYLRLNEEFIPTISIRYSPKTITPEAILDRINMEKWNIVYKDGPKEESARFHFDQIGKVSDWK